MDPSYDPRQQPGLEVVPRTHHSGLEVVSSSLPEVANKDHDTTKEVAGADYSSAPYSGHDAVPKLYSPPRPIELGDGRPQHGAGKWRFRWVIGAVIVAVVILAAVLGGVLGSRAARSSGESSASTAGESGDPGGSGNTGGPETSGAGGSSSSGFNSSDTAIKPPQLLRPGSGLSVTGWRTRDGTAETYLFFQDPLDGVWYSRCDAGRRIPGNDSACWEAPVSFTSSAKAGTPLAASTVVWGDADQPQVQLHYIGGKTRLLGVNFNEQNTPSIGKDSVDAVQIYTGLDSALTAYWPWTMYQDSTGMIHQVRNRLKGGDWSRTSSWDNSPINKTALVASSMAVVPTSTTFTTVGFKGGYAVFYQDPNDKLAVDITDLSSPKVPKTFHLPWPTTLPDITLPKLAPLAAFSVARKGDTLQRVDTYLLYLDGDANINMLYTDSSSSNSDSTGAVWKTVAPSALQGADQDTSITCLTMATTNNNAAKQAVPLEEASADNRCYFQKGGLVVEVTLDRGKQDWVVTGTVPIP